MADSYEGLEIKFIKGKDAVLYLHDEDGNETSQIPLNSITNIEELHQLMIDLGFKRTKAHDPLPEVPAQVAIGSLQI